MLVAVQTLQRRLFRNSVIIYDFLPRVDELVSNMVGRKLVVVFLLEDTI